MTRAQERFATFAEWLTQSSRASRRSPLGDPIDVGPYAVVIPQPLDVPPNPAPLGCEHLPLWISDAQVVSKLPSHPDTDTPAGQLLREDRLRHLIWMFEDRRFAGALVPLIEPNESLQSALDRNLPGFDLSELPVIFFAAWDLDWKTRSWVDSRLPLVCQTGSFTSTPTNPPPTGPNALLARNVKAW